MSDVFANIPGPASTFTFSSSSVYPRASIVTICFAPIPTSVDHGPAADSAAAAGSEDPEAEEAAEKAEEVVEMTEAERIKAERKAARLAKRAKRSEGKMSNKEVRWTSPSSSSSLSLSLRPSHSPVSLPLPFAPPLVRYFSGRARYLSQSRARERLSPPSHRDFSFREYIKAPPHNAAAHRVNSKCSCAAP